MTINRREILKLSAGALVAVLASPFLSAQTNTNPVGAGPKTGVVPSTAIDGNISYNAGWVVPLEDKAGLLELEAKKTKERDDLVKQKAGSPTDSSGAAKDQSKSIGKRFQELLGKVKSFF
jgi:hypothetical protein